MNTAHKLPATAVTAQTLGLSFFFCDWSRLSVSVVKSTKARTAAAAHRLRYFITNKNNKKKPSRCLGVEKKTQKKFVLIIVESRKKNNNRESVSARESVRRWISLHRTFVGISSSSRSSNSSYYLFDTFVTRTSNLESKLTFVLDKSKRIVKFITHCANRLSSEEYYTAKKRDIEKSCLKKLWRVLSWYWASRRSSSESMNWEGWSKVKFLCKEKRQVQHLIHAAVSTSEIETKSNSADRTRFTNWVV